MYNKASPPPLLRCLMALLLGCLLQAAYALEPLYPEAKSADPADLPAPHCNTRCRTRCCIF